MRHPWTLAAAAAALLCSTGTDVQAELEDPGEMGPLGWTRVEYNFDDPWVPPPGIQLPGPVEVAATVHHPTDLPAGPYPLLLFAHGVHATCQNGPTTSFLWPCPQGHTPILNRDGYDYVAEVLASHGYIVVSVGFNGINAFLTSEGPELAERVALLDHHVDLWQDFNTTGAPPFDDDFVGAIDFSRFGTLGHSRGGQAIASHVVANAADPNNAHPVRATLLIAPGHTPSVGFLTSRDVSLAVLLPYCDGGTPVLQGVRYFDDVMYAPSDGATKHVIVSMRSNHNFFNSVWTEEDQFTLGPHCSPSARLTPVEQRALGAAFISAFFRTHVGGETRFLPILTGHAPTPPSSPDDVVLSFQAPSARRLDLRSISDPTDPSTNALEGDVTLDSQAPAASDFCTNDCTGGQVQPHVHRQLDIKWEAAPAPVRTYRNEIPEGDRDLTGFTDFQLRASVNHTKSLPPGASQDLSVTLEDGSGGSATLLASDVSTALFFPPGGAPGVSLLPRSILNTIAFPLQDFSPAVDLTDVRSVELRFDRGDAGALLISDLAFSNLDKDGDGVPDAQDNCPLFNPDQSVSTQTVPPDPLAQGIPCACLCGDVNGDCTINTADYLEILNFTGLQPPFFAFDEQYCDVNRDGACNSADGLEILFYSAFMLPQDQIVLGEPYLCQPIGE